MAQDNKEALSGQVVQLPGSGQEVLLPGRHRQGLCQVVWPVPWHDSRPVIQILQPEEHQRQLCGDLYKMLNCPNLIELTIGLIKFCFNFSPFLKKKISKKKKKKKKKS